MRRRLLLALASGTLFLGACSDQTPTEPTVPSENFGTSCSAPRFPLLAIANQIKAIYPATPPAQALLRAEALLRAGAIKLLWDTCHPAAAKRVAFAFIDWLNRHTPAGKEDQVKALILTILRGIGEITGPAADGDFGIGFFDPDNDENTVITTLNEHALISLEPGSFLVPTVIVISRVAGDPPLTGFDGNQFPPTYDYNAINSTNTHVLQPGKTANIAFCLVIIGGPETPGNGYPDPANLVIGHNPFGGGFEILEPFTLEGTELRNSLTCPGIDDVIGSAGGGLQNFANAALQTAGRFLMPQPLWAAALGELPPPPPRTGKAGGLSPFKPVEVEAEAPSPGADIVVFNDLNMFDNTAAADPNNLAFYANLVSYTGPGTRTTNTRVLVHRGHSVRCDNDSNSECSIEGWSTFENTMREVGSGYTVDDVDDESAPLTTIAANVKVIILALPMTAYSTAEINALKAFAGEGGRIVFVGEYDSFYGAGIAVENAFLTSMGAVMTNTGGAVDCFNDPPEGYKVLPSSSLRSHQLTGGLTQLTIACASVVDPGPDDYPLFYDTSGELVLGAVAKVDLTPLPIILSRAAEVAPTSTQSAALSNDAAGRGVVSRVPAGAQR